MNQLAKHLNVRIYDDNYITVEHKNYAKPTKKVDPAKKDLYEYFKKRGISEDTVDFAEIDFSEDKPANFCLFETEHFEILIQDPVFPNDNN